MKRRALLTGASAALLSKQAAARFPRGSAGVVGGATIAGAVWPTTNVLGGDYIPVSLRWATTAPASITTATWSGAGGSGTILSGSFAQTGRTVQFLVSTPSPGSTTSYNLSLTADTGANVVLTGISVVPPLVDLAPGIYGPTTVYFDTSQPNTDSHTFSQLPIAAYVSRGLPGVLTATITDTVPASGDATSWCLNSKLGGYQGLLTPGFNLCPATFSFTEKTSYAIDINITNGIATQTIAVTVLRPAANRVSDFAWLTTYGGSYYTFYSTNQILLESAKANPDFPGVVTVVQLFTNAVGITFTPDVGGLFSFPGGNGTTVQIDQADLAGNIGHHTCTVQATSGPSQTLDFWILKTRPPVIAWQPNGSIYSSTPTTTGYLGSNLIGTLAAYSDEHGQMSSSLSFRYEIVSDSSGALQIWNTGQVYLTAPVSVGTIDADVDITSNSGITQRVHLSLPVLAGTTLAASNITPTISTGLTNFVPYANGLRGSSTAFPYGNPIAVGTFTVTGMTVDWAKIQTALVLGNTFDNAQIPEGGDTTDFNQNIDFSYNIPRYLVSGSGTSGTITATNLSAISYDTPQVDTLRIQLTDGAGTYCTKDIPITVSWHTAPIPSVTVGPGGDFANPRLLQEAFWDDFDALGAAADYAGTIIEILPGCDTIAPDGWCYHRSSGFTAGWWPYPVAIWGTDAVQWSGNASISGTALTINSTISGAIKAGDYFASGVGATKIMIMSGAGASWTVHIGPDMVSATASISSTAMTTKTPRAFLDFAHTAPFGSQQGGIGKNHYDVDFRRVEIAGCTLAYGDAPPGPNYIESRSTAAGIYTLATGTGNLYVDLEYIHDCDVGILHGAPGCHVTATNNMIIKCGNGAGTQHNVYFDTVAKLVFTNNQCNDTLVGHEFKTRAMQNTVEDNIFAQGLNSQGSCPINYTINGAMSFKRNIVVKTPNDVPSLNSLFHQLNDEWNGDNGVTGGTIGVVWAYQNSVIDACEYYNLVPRATSPFQAIQCFSSTGAALQKITGVNGFMGDGIRNTPFGTTITNSGFYNMSFPDEYSFETYGGDAPVYGSGNSTLTTFPASAIRLVDPITGTPPFRLPQQGPYGYWFGGHRTSTFGSSPGVYYMSLTVPSGSPSGTDVIGGELTAYDGNFAPLTSETYSFNNDYTADNASFSLSSTADGIQLKTVGSLTDGLKTVTLQCVGTGWDPVSQTTTTITSISSFRVIVGGYT